MSEKDVDAVRTSGAMTRNRRPLRIDLLPHACALSRRKTEPRPSQGENIVHIGIRLHHATRGMA
jgi:hypothetical protein